MKTPIAITLLGAVALSGCASKLNPVNWFGKSQSKTYKEVVIPVKPADLRGLVDQVTLLRVEKAPGGAIIHAVGLPHTQGYWDAELVPEFGEQPVKGVLSYSFRIQKPLGFEKAGSAYSREVDVGYFVSNQKLVGVNTIRVLGEKNARSVRR
ncbi:MAG: hypothetical protein CSA68_04415 [Rhodobacterales bacterium]|nr:MAG: hypothetical protein CSA68_04415 [Rhodobacterales bacterium]